jgi:hypothetical protein
LAAEGRAELSPGNPSLYLPIQPKFAISTFGPVTVRFSLLRHNEFATNLPPESYGNHMNKPNPDKRITKALPLGVGFDYSLYFLKQAAGTGKTPSILGWM